MRRIGWSVCSGTAVAGMLLLVGCGGTTHAVAPPHIVAAVHPAPHHAPIPDAATQTALGHVLAVETLARQALSQLSQASEARSEQLPASASADMADATALVQEAEYLLPRVNAPAQLNQAVLDLRMSVTSLDLATAAGKSQGSQVSEAQRSLASANVALHLGASGSLAGVQRATQQMLTEGKQEELRQKAAAKPTATPHKTVPHHAPYPTHPRVKAHAAVPTATPVPTARPTATAARHIKKQHAHRKVVRITHPKHARVARHHVVRAKAHPTSTSVPTATPTPRPTAVPTTVPTPRPTPAPASVFALAPFRPRIQRASAQMTTAWTSLGQCATYIDGIRTGKDVGGSDTIQTCLSTSTAALTQVSHALKPVAEHANDALVVRRFGSALHHLRQAHTGLQTVNHQVDAVDLNDAATTLTSVQAKVDAVRQLLTTVLAGQPL